MNLLRTGAKGENMRTSIRTSVRFAAGAAALALVAVACGSDSTSSSAHDPAPGAATGTAAAPAGGTTPAGRSRCGDQACRQPVDRLGRQRQRRQGRARVQARYPDDVGRPRRELLLERARFRRSRRQLGDLAVGPRQGPQDLHRGEEERRRSRQARAVGQDRLVRAVVRHRPAPGAEDLGRVQGPHPGQAVRHRRDGRPRPVPDG